jgi:hypothetical protein
MSDYEDESYYDDMAEAWDQRSGGGGGGGGGAKKIKKKAKPTVVGKQRVGSVAWVGTVKLCVKGCAKKCCSGPKTTPSLSC